MSLPNGLFPWFCLANYLASGITCCCHRVISLPLFAYYKKLHYFIKSTLRIFTSPTFFQIKSVLWGRASGFSVLMNCLFTRKNLWATYRHWTKASASKLLGLPFTMLSICPTSELKQWRLWSQYFQPAIPVVGIHTYVWGPWKKGAPISQEHSLAN